MIKDDEATHLKNLCRKKKGLREPATTYPRKHQRIEEREKASDQHRLVDGHSLRRRVIIKTPKQLTNEIKGVYRGT